MCFLENLHINFSQDNGNLIEKMFDFKNILNIETRIQYMYFYFPFYFVKNLKMNFRVSQKFTFFKNS